MKPPRKRPRPPRRLDAPDGPVWRNPQDQYKPELVDVLLHWFTPLSEVDDLREVNFTAKGQQQVFSHYKLPTFEGFCGYIGCSLQSVHIDWPKRHPEWRAAMVRCKLIQADIIQRATAIGMMPPNFAALILRNNHSWETAAGGVIGKPKDNPDAPEGGGTELPEATGFAITLVRERDEAYYQLWKAARQKNELLKKDLDEGLEAFAFYDQVD